MRVGVTAVTSLGFLVKKKNLIEVHESFES